VIQIAKGQKWVLSYLESAQRELPRCEVCYALTTPVARGGDLWLECSAVQRERPLIRRLLTLEFPSLHTRRLLVEDAA
jgi:hypothetical protein